MALFACCESCKVQYYLSVTVGKRAMNPNDEILILTVRSVKASPLSSKIFSHKRRRQNFPLT